MPLALGACGLLGPAPAGLPAKRLDPDSALDSGEAGSSDADAGRAFDANWSGSPQDGGSLDARPRVDTGAPADAGPREGGLMDGSPMEGGLLDAGPLPSCGRPPEPHTVALWTFDTYDVGLGTAGLEGGFVNLARAEHPLLFQPGPSSEPPRLVPSGCGHAYVGTSGAFLFVDDDTAYGSGEGAVEVFFTILRALDSTQALFSRDRHGGARGHVHMAITASRQLTRCPGSCRAPGEALARRTCHCHLSPDPPHFLGCETSCSRRRPCGESSVDLRAFGGFWSSGLASRV